MINLLPWREQQKRHKFYHFLAGWLSVELLCVLLIVLWIQFLLHKNQHLVLANQKLQQQLSQFTQVTRSQRLQPARAHANSQFITQILVSLPQLMSDSVSLAQINYEHAEVQLHGYAASNTELAKFIGQLAATSWTKTYRLANSHYSVEKKRVEFKLILPQPGVVNAQ